MSEEELSKYDTADESLSAPTELLSEFLSAVMCKDYESALHYCKLILQYEPENATAKDFYPLILHKLSQQGGDNFCESVSNQSNSTTGSFASLLLDEQEDDDKINSNQIPTDPNGNYSSL